MRRMAFRTSIGMLGIACIGSLTAPSLDGIMYPVHAPPGIITAACIRIQSGLRVTLQAEAAELVHVLADACSTGPVPVVKGAFVDVIRWVTGATIPTTGASKPH